MAKKNKPRWKDLTTEERIYKKAKRFGFSEDDLEFLKERADGKTRECNLAESRQFDEQINTNTYAALSMETFTKILIRDYLGATENSMKIIDNDIFELLMQGYVLVEEN